MAQKKFIIDGGFRTNEDSIIEANLEMSGHIIPTIDSDGIVGYDLGSPEKKWRDLYLSEGSLYIDGQKVLESDAGTIIVQADENQSLTTKTTGTGVLTFASPNPIAIASTLQMGTGKRITSADGLAVVFGDKVDMDNNQIINVAAPTADGHVATKGYVDSAVNDVLNGAPAALDTLNELANALGDDANFAATVTNALATKATITYVDEQIAAATSNAGAEAANAYTDEREAAITTAYQAYADTAEADAVSTAAADATAKADAAQTAATTAANSYTDGRETAITTAYQSADTALDSAKVDKTSAQALHATDALSIGGNIITLRKGDGTTETVDISPYLDDTNLSRIVSGTMNSSGVATFTRDDNSTFTVDMSVLLDDTNLSRIVSADWNTGNGVLTLTRNDSTSVTVDLDGRYQPAGTYNTVIGTDTDIDTSGSTIIDNIYVTDGVITNMGTRTLTASDIGAQPAGTYNTVIGTDTDLNTSGSTIIDNIYVTDGVITSMGTRTLTASAIGAQPAGSYVYQNSGQALHSSDALRLSGNVLSLHKANGLSESVTLESGGNFTTTSGGYSGVSPVASGVIHYSNSYDKLVMTRGRLVMTDDGDTPVEIRAGSMTGAYTLVLPPSLGTDGQVLTLVDDGFGNITSEFADPAGGGGEFTATYLNYVLNPATDGNAQNDYFGNTVRVSGKYGIAGIYQEDTGGTDSGIAHIFDVETGTVVHTLVNPTTYSSGAYDRFGYHVDISGNFAIVGAYGEDVDAAGLYGSDSGAAYIFNVSTGELVHTLRNPNAYNTGAYDNFGMKVGISDKYAIVGARQEDEAAGSTSGKVYVFDVASGELVRTIDNPNFYSTPQSDQFGGNLSIYGSRAVVTAGGENSSAGTAYIINLNTGDVEHMLVNPNAAGTVTNDYFGSGLDISEKYIVVGAKGEDVGGLESGVAYVYDVHTGNLLYTLQNPNAAGSKSYDSFGSNASVSGDYAVISSPSEDFGTSGSGSVYVFDLTTGSLVATIQNPNITGTAADSFGQGISIDGNRLSINASGEDTPASNAGVIYNYSLSTVASAPGIDNIWATASAYAPSTPADWNGTPPSTVGEAIDRLAALVKTLNGGTGA
jgi:hypothetical protein